MAIQPCPACERDDTTKALAHMSPHTDVTYYRCALCGHVWVVFKGGEVHHVTPLADVERTG